LESAIAGSRWPNWPSSARPTIPLGLCDRIVDLVSSGATLKANGLVEVEHIADITSRLIVNRTALKTRSEEISHWVERFREARGAA
jgi:ATP phosphoribosyltransferase